MSRQEFFLQAADWQHFAAQRNFARHGDIGAHGDARQGRHHGRGDRDTRGRTVLGSRAFRHVDVHIVLFEDAVGKAQTASARTHNGAGRFNRFLHHIAERTRALDDALARHVRDFDRQQVAADFRPRQTSHLTGLVFLFGHAEGVAAHAQVVAQVVARDVDRLDLEDLALGLGAVILGQQLLDDLAADLAHFAFERTHTGFAGVIAHDIAQRAVVDSQLAILHAVVLHQLGQQMVTADMDLLFLGVTRQADHFHAVQKRGRNVQRVAGCHEHDVGQVEVDFDVVVLERVVLFRVQHFEQRRRRIAAEVHAQLVDFIKQEQGIAHADLRHVLDDLARHGTDVRTAMAADLGFVAHAAQRHADELAVRRLGDGLPQRGLAHARRADQAQDRSLHLVHALLHGKIFEDPFLDLFEAIVVVVQHRFGVADRIVDLALLPPGEVDERIDVVAHHRGFGRHRRHELELLELGIGLFARLFRHVGSDDLLFKLFDVRALFAFAQLLLNGLDLLIQVVVALALFHLLLHAAANPLFDLKNVDFGFELGKQTFKALGRADDLEHLLLLLELQRKMRGDRVSQAARIIDASQRGQDLRGDLLVEFYVLLELSHDRAAQGFGFGALHGVGFDRRNLAGEMRIGIFNTVDAGALGAFDQHLDGAIGQLEHLQDAGNATDFVDVFRRGVILAGGLLGHQHDALARFHRNLERAYGARTADEQRDDHVREHYDIAQRQQGKVDRVGRQGLAGRHRRFLGMTRRIGDGVPGNTRANSSVTSVMGTIAENSRSRRQDNQKAVKTPDSALSMRAPPRREKRVCTSGAPIEKKTRYENGLF
ncbi:hypothetical protein D3C85_712880 [compost metagenome]